MVDRDTLDFVSLAVLLVWTLAYFTKGNYWAKGIDPSISYNAYQALAGNEPVERRDIVEKMKELNKNCVVFYGSQTGTAEDYASRLAKEAKSRFGLEIMVADLKDFDFKNLDSFPKTNTANFILAIYGEGEPTDNAADFYEFITGTEVVFSHAANPSIGNLNFFIFGLRNSSYEHYNSMFRAVGRALEKLGGTRIGKAGEGDDRAGTMEEDFLAWKNPM